MKKRNLLYLLPLVFAVGCEPEFDEINFNNGTADFTRTVALGNSLTAGIQGYALSRVGQEYSIPEILAKQFALVGGGEFSTPLLSGEAGTKGAGVDPNRFSQGILLPSLGFVSNTDCRGTTSSGPGLSSAPYAFNLAGAIDPTGQVDASGFYNIDKTQGKYYNNVGVSGARLIHLNFPSYASANPYFGRFALGANQTMLSYAMNVNATFFTLFIGGNDVLGYATSGGDEGGDAITDAATFAALYAQTVDSLTKNGAKGAVSNIPSITSIPYFNTVPANVIQLSGPNTALLNAAYANYNALIEGYRVATVITDEEAALRTISFADGANYMLTSDPNLSALTNPTNGQPVPKLRQLKAGELVTLTLPQDSLKCAGWGTQKPVPGQFVLLSHEIENIDNAVNSYNSSIKSIADAKGLAFVDANSKLKEAQSGLKFNGTTFTTEYVKGGSFSLDGIHPSTRGYAIIANTFIEAINKAYNANVPQVNVNNYPTLF
jgi:lysophospholipase L1-like esterase